MKKSINVKLSELVYLRDRSLLIVDFLLRKNVENSMIKQFRTVIQDSYDKSNLKGLKTLSRDMNAWAKSLSEKDMKELEILLEKKFGESLSGDKITRKLIEEILRKGSIENAYEYRVVYDYLQEISDKDPFYEKLLELENLLEKYQD